MFVTYPPYLREKARSLRTDKRLTIDELAERLAISRTTIFYWVRDIPIPITVRQSDSQRRGTRAMVRRFERLREEAYAEGRATFASLAAADPSFRDFVNLYLAEGYRGAGTTSRSETRTPLSSSSPIHGFAA